MDELVVFVDFYGQWFCWVDGNSYEVWGGSCFECLEFWVYGGFYQDDFLEEYYGQCSCSCEFLIDIDCGWVFSFVCCRFIEDVYLLWFVSCMLGIVFKYDYLYLGGVWEWQLWFEGVS